MNSLKMFTASYSVGGRLLHINLGRPRYRLASPAFDGDEFVRARWGPFRCAGKAGIGGSDALGRLAAWVVVDGLLYGPSPRVHCTCILHWHEEDSVTREGPQTFLSSDLIVYS
jgi:hypothetical protein